MSNNEVVEDYDATRSRSYKTVFSGTGSDFVIKDLMEVCSVNQTSYTPQDPYHTTYNEGKRAVFMYITSLLKTDDLELFNKMKEQTNRGGSSEDEQKTSDDTISDFAKGLF